MLSLYTSGVTRRVKQILVFICWLDVLVSLYSFVVIYYLDIQVINAFFIRVPRNFNRTMGLFDVRQKFHQFILEDIKTLRNESLLFLFFCIFFIFLCHTGAVLSPAELSGSWSFESTYSVSRKWRLAFFMLQTDNPSETRS